MSKLDECARTQAEYINTDASICLYLHKTQAVDWNA